MSAVRVPPVNATIVALERAGVVAWSGSAPAYCRRRHDWVPTSTGARISTQTTELTIPPLPYTPPPVDTPPDDFPPPPDTPPPDPDDPPPPPPTGGTDDYPYTPPVSPPAPDTPAVGSYHDELTKTIGYGDGGPAGPHYSRLNHGRSGDPSAFPPLAGVGGLWAHAVHAALGIEYAQDDPSGGGTLLGSNGRKVSIPYAEQLDTGHQRWATPPPPAQYHPLGLFQGNVGAGAGFHWRLGITDGLIDQTGLSNHGSAGASRVILGAMANRWGEANAATYFAGGDAKIVSPINPWTTGVVMTSADETATAAEYADAEFPGGWRGPTLWPGSVTHSEVLRGYVGAQIVTEVWGSRGYTYPLFPNPTVPDGAGVTTLPTVRPEPNDLNTPWRATTVSAPWDVRLLYGPPTVVISGWVRRENTLADHTLFCTAGPDAFRLYLPAGSRRPVFETWPSLDDPLGGAGGASGPSSGKHQWTVDAWPVNQNQWVQWVAMIPAAQAATCYLWVNGQQIPFYTTGYSATWGASGNAPIGQKRVEELGVVEWTTADHGAIVAGHHVDGWRGAMHDFCVLVSRMEDIPQDPGPPYLQFADLGGGFANRPPSPAIAASGFHLQPNEIYGLPIISGGATDPTIAPAVGDRVTFDHAGQELTITVNGFEEREDFGYYKLVSASAGT